MLPPLTLAEHSQRTPPSVRGRGPGEDMYGTFPNIRRGTLFWGPYNEDPTI